MNSPDPVLHLKISLVKSALRIAAGTALAFSMFASAGILFILSEALGVAEELV